MPTNWPTDDMYVRPASQGSPSRAAGDGSGLASAVVTALAVGALVLAALRPWRAGAYPHDISIVSLVVPDAQRQLASSRFASATALLVLAAALAVLGTALRSILLCLLAASLATFTVGGFMITEAIRYTRAGGHVHLGMYPAGVWAAVLGAVLLWIVPWVMPFKRWS